MKKRLIAAALTMAMAAGMMPDAAFKGKPAEAWRQQPQRMQETQAKAEEAKTEASQDGAGVGRRHSSSALQFLQGPSEMEPGRRQHEGRAGRQLDTRWIYSMRAMMSRPGITD